MKRLFLIAMVAVLLTGLGVIAWTLAGLPPARMVWRYGFSYGPEPTGEKKTLEGVEFVRIGPGCYRKGSDHRAKGGDWLGRWCAQLGLPWGDHPEPSDEMPLHWVEFPRGYWMARTEVTNEQFEAFLPEHERCEYSTEDRDPVVNVSWDDAMGYCAWLSGRSGLAIRLPSESEWECASRAGSNREYCFGDDEKLLPRLAWFRGNSAERAFSVGRTHEVGTRQANAWGLHDLHGNVWEWCGDTYQESYEGAPTDGTAWAREGTLIRVYRGGGFNRDAANCRSAYRTWTHFKNRSWNRGFRPAFIPSVW